MKIDSTPDDKRKSFLLAILIYATLLLVLFFIRFWPPSNLAELTGGGGGGGMTVNFGDSDVGSGNDFKSKELEIKQPTKTSSVTPAPTENIIAQENNDETDVSIKKIDVKKKTQIVVKKNEKPVKIIKPVVKKTDDALANLLHGNKKGGDGNSSSSGNQGRSNGDINSNGYSGSGGSGGGNGGGNGSGNGTGTGAGSGTGSGGGNGNGKGSGSGYSLGNRKALSTPQPAYNCNEEGIVVVQITVDQNGKVVEAKPGARGTTNTAGCLASQAKIAALNTKWESSPDGNEKQVGSITYIFKIKN
ncbi:MAG: energy transducer TonB [Flavobacterium sp.]|nr:energy transducer TonB [Flavobacterium sp.]